MPANRQILIIEDDTLLRKELTRFLETHGYEVSAPETFANVMEEALHLAPALILLDLGLPGQDGHHICKELRSRSQVPIIVVTSRYGEMDELMSIHLGADDFITKPYNTHILLARIENLLRRTYGNTDNLDINVRGVTLHLADSTLSFASAKVELTKNECRILQMLMKQEGNIISRDEIMTSLWQSDEFVDDNTLTVNINRLRKKLEALGVEGFIQTKRGQGYLI